MCLGYHTTGTSPRKAKKRMRLHCFLRSTPYHVQIGCLSAITSNASRNSLDSVSKTGSREKIGGKTTKLFSTDSALAPTSHLAAASLTISLWALPSGVQLNSKQHVLSSRLTTYEQHHIPKRVNTYRYIHPYIQHHECCQTFTSR